MDPWAQLSAEHARTGDRSAMIASSAAIFQSVESCQLRRAFLRGGYNPGPLSLLIVTWIHLEVSSRLTRLLHSVPVLGGWQNFWIVEWWPVDVDFLGHKLGYWVRKLHITNIPHTHIIFIFIYIHAQIKHTCHDLFADQAISLDSTRQTNDVLSRWNPRKALSVQKEISAWPCYFSLCWSLAQINLLAYQWYPTLPLDM